MVQMVGAHSERKIADKVARPAKGGVLELTDLGLMRRDANPPKPDLTVGRITPSTKFFIAASFRVLPSGKVSYGIGDLLHSHGTLS